MYGYGYGAGAAVGVVVLMIFGGLIAVAASIAQFVSWCMLFHKAGLPWERNFVPIYGSYWSYKMVRAKQIFWLQLGLRYGWALLTGLLMLAGSVGVVLSWIFGIIFAGALITLNVIYCIRLARAYGKSGGFVVGLVLVPFVFLPILAFGDAQYRYRIRQRTPHHQA